MKSITFLGKYYAFAEMGLKANRVTPQLPTKLTVDYGSLLTVEIHPPSAEQSSDT